MSLYKIARFREMAEASGNTSTLVVVCPYDDETLIAAADAHEMKIVTLVFVGEADRIRTGLEENKVYLEEGKDFELIDASDDTDAAQKAMIYARDHENVSVMKGLIATSTLLKQLLNKEYQLTTGETICHVGILYNVEQDVYYTVSDAAMNILPDQDQKESIIRSMTSLLHKMGNDKPHIALLAAKEQPYEKMKCTQDAANLHEKWKAGEFPGCVVSGPLQVDVALSHEAATIKGVMDPVAGRADAFVVPNIETGNVAGKVLQHCAGFISGGVVMGAKVPVVLVSRADSRVEKVLSIMISAIAS